MIIFLYILFFSHIFFISPKGKCEPTNSKLHAYVSVTIYIQPIRHHYKGISLDCKELVPWVCYKIFSIYHVLWLHNVRMKQHLTLVCFNSTFHAIKNPLLRRKSFTVILIIQLNLFNCGVHL